MIIFLSVTTHRVVGLPGHLTIRTPTRRMHGWEIINGPTKSYLWINREKTPEMSHFYALNFGKRPAEELYSMEEDPDQTVNLADDPKYAEVKKLLSERLTAQLRSLQILGNLWRGSI